MPSTKILPPQQMRLIILTRTRSLNAVKELMTTSAGRLCLLRRRLQSIHLHLLGLQSLNVQNSSSERALHRHPICHCLLNQQLLNAWNSSNVKIQNHQTTSLNRTNRFEDLKADRQLHLRGQEADHQLKAGHQFHFHSYLPKELDISNDLLPR